MRDISFFLTAELPSRYCFQLISDTHDLSAERQVFLFFKFIIPQVPDECGSQLTQLLLLSLLQYNNSTYNDKINRNFLFITTVYHGFNKRPEGREKNK